MQNLVHLSVQHRRIGRVAFGESSLVKIQLCIAQLRDLDCAGCAVLLLLRAPFKRAEPVAQCVQRAGDIAQWFDHVGLRAFAKADHKIRLCRRAAQTLTYFGQWTQDAAVQKEIQRQHDKEKTGDCAPDNQKWHKQGMDAIRVQHAIQRQRAQGFNAVVDAAPQGQ